ncbi:MAG: hypothetical protein ACLQBJ_14475 [Bryobacteraceae bacterium]
MKQVRLSEAKITSGQAGYMSMPSMSNEDFIRGQVKALTVITCIVLAVNDLRAQRSGSRAWLLSVGVDNPCSSDLELLGTLIRRKAVVGSLVAIAIPAAYIALLHYWRLPPFNW